MATFETLILVLFWLHARKGKHHCQRSAGTLKQIDPGKMVSVLQECQRLMKDDSLSGVPSLADLERVIQATQAEFGPFAELETVIQRILAQEALEPMSEQRRASKAKCCESKHPQHVHMGAGVA